MECTDLYVKRIVCVIPLISSDVSHLLIKLFVQSRTSASPRPRASCCWWVTNSTDNLVTWQLSFYLGIRAIGGTRYLGRHQCPVFALHAQLDKMPLPGCRRGRRTTTKPTVALASPPACLLDIGKKKKQQEPGCWYLFHGSVFIQAVMIYFTVKTFTGFTFWSLKAKRFMNKCGGIPID